MKRSFTIRMRSDDLAGDAKASRADTYIRGRALVKRSFTIGMRSDDLAGDAEASRADTYI